MSATLTLWLAASACGLAGDENKKPGALLKPGDRVAFVGGTFWEDERRSGAIETALTLAVPDVTFRHLGWGGDMADQSARRYFGTAADGRAHLLTHLDVADPTVILVAYGAAESLPGGMPADRFEATLNSLLDELEKRTGRVVLVGPLPPRPARAGGPVETDDHFRLYQEAVIRTALLRGLPLVMTVDWKRAELDLGFNGAGLDANLVRKPISPEALMLSGLKLPEKFATPPSSAAAPPVPSSTERNAGLVGGLLYGLRATADRADAAGRRDLFGRLGETIREKNAIFLHRHRPQNETYLRGFRAHEQGANAAEIERFDALVAAEDAEIQVLRNEILKGSE